MSRELAIIGAGTAGLSAGVYAAASGYRVTVLEMAGTSGGLCATWRRGGYVFDGSAAGLAGSGPGAPLYRMWKELGVIGRCPLRDPESFGCVRLSDGRNVTVWTDIDRFEAHFLETFPRDARAVRVFSAALRACLRFDMPLAGEPRYDEPGLDGFWRAGQWVEAWGGITTAAQSGRNAVRAMCLRDGVTFAPGL